MSLVQGQLHPGKFSCPTVVLIRLPMGGSVGLTGTRFRLARQAQINHRRRFGRRLLKMKWGQSGANRPNDPSPESKSASD